MSTRRIVGLSLAIALGVLCAPSVSHADLFHHHAQTTYRPVVTPVACSSCQAAATPQPAIAYSPVIAAPAPMYAAPAYAMPSNQTTFRPVIQYAPQTVPYIPTTVQYAPQVAYSPAMPVTTYRPVIAPSGCNSCSAPTLQPVTSYYVPYTAAYAPAPMASGCSSCSSGYTAAYAPAPIASGCSSCAAGGNSPYISSSPVTTPTYSSPAPAPSYSQSPTLSAVTPSQPSTINNTPTPAIPGAEKTYQRPIEQQPAATPPAATHDTNKPLRPVDPTEAGPELQPIPRSEGTTSGASSAPLRSSTPSGLFRPAPQLPDPQDKSTQTVIGAKVYPAVLNAPRKPTQAEIDAEGWVPSNR